MGTLAPVETEPMTLLYLFFLSTFLSFDTNALAATEIELKSIVSDDRSKVFVELKIPEQKQVGFELFNAENKIVHFWHDQTLSTGSHFLKLDFHKS